MSSYFNPLLWFVCRLCRQAFPDTERLKKHKLQKHPKECEKIKCIIFEERLLESQWIPTDTIYFEPKAKIANAILPEPIYCHCSNCECASPVLFSPSRSKDTTDSKKQKPGNEPIIDPNSDLHLTPRGITSPNKQQQTPTEVSNSNFNPDSRLRPIPFVSLKRLTQREINEALFKNQSNSNPKHESPKQTSATVKRRISECPQHASPPNKKQKHSEHNPNIARHLFDNDSCIPNEVKIDHLIDDASEVVIISVSSIPELPTNLDLINFTEEDDNDYDAHSNLPDPISPSSSIVLFNINSDPETCDFSPDKIVDENAEDHMECDIRIDSSIFDTSGSQDDEPIHSGKSSIVSTKNPHPKLSKNLVAVPKQTRARNSLKQQISTPGPAPKNIRNAISEPQQILIDMKTNGKEGTAADAAEIIDVDLAEIREDIPTTTRTLANNQNQDEFPPEYNTRSRRTRSKKINYSEDHICSHCNKDFYSHDDLEDHEKSCPQRNKNSGKKSAINQKPTFRKKSTANSSTLFQSEAERIKLLSRNEVDSDDAEIVELGRDADECKDKDYECQQDDDNNDSDVGTDDSVSEGQSDTDIEVTSIHNFSFNKSSRRGRPKKSSKKQGSSSAWSHTDSEGEVDEQDLSLVDWLKLKKQSSNNFILLEPDITKKQKQSDTTSSTDINISPENPLTCKLCRTKLETESEVKNHVQNCWFHNKTRHVHCVSCNIEFKYPRNLISHLLQKFKNFYSQNVFISFGHLEHSVQDQENANAENSECTINEGNENFSENNLSLFQWIQNWGQKFPDIILLEPEPQMNSSQVVSKFNPIKCKLCTTLLVSPSEVKSHIRICWSYNKSYHRFCIECNQSFAKVKDFREHNRKIHNNGMQIESRSLLFCPECHQEFYTIGAYREHCVSLKDFCTKMKGFEIPERNKKYIAALYSGSASVRWKEIQPKPTQENETETVILKLPWRQVKPRQIQPKPTPSAQAAMQNSLPAQESNEANANEINEIKLSLMEYLLLCKQSTRPPYENEDTECFTNLSPLPRISLPDNLMNIIRLEPDPTLDPENFCISKEKPVTCKLCAKKLVTESELRNHVENCWLHNKQRHIFCVLCNRQWSLNSGLRRHNQANHYGILTDNLPLHEWLEVQRKKPKVIILLDPELSTNPENSPSFPIKCKLCQHQLISELHLRNHVQMCWKQNRSKHRYCVPCDKLFSSNYMYSNHNRSWHSTLSESYSSPNCKVCEKQFGNEEALNLHQRSLETFLVSVEKVNRRKSKTNLPTETNIGQNARVQDEPPEQTTSNLLTVSDLFNWLKTERQIPNLDGTKKVILIDPEPQSDDKLEVNKNNPIKCLLCSKKLITIMSVKSHVGSCWTLNKVNHVYCVPCKTSFKFKKHLQEHNMKEHLEDVNKEPTAIFKCIVCSQILPDEKFFKAHMELHNDPNFKPFQCPHCPMVFRKSVNLAKHLIVHGSVTRFKCRYCNRSCATNSFLQVHERTHTGDRPFKCTVPSCSNEFSTKMSLCLHTKAKHFAELGLRQFLCPICGKVFGLKSKLDRHNMVNHSSEKPFKCTEEGCTKAFKHGTQLTEHKREHTGETPYQCDECGRAFSKSFSFIKHKRSHQGTLNQAMCHLCPRKFLGNWELKQHLKKVHNGEEGNDDLGTNTPSSSGFQSKSKFNCQDCGQECNSKIALRKHEKMHEEESEESQSENSDSDLQ